MSFLSSIFGTEKKPSADSIRDTLFGDMPLGKWPPAGTDTGWSPWSDFVAAREQLASGRKEKAVEAWLEILEQTDLEPRHYLQAWHFLRQQGQQPPKSDAKNILGVVVEVGMPKGLDLLAAYADHSARYYNFSGKAVIWEHRDESLDPLIDDLIAASHDVVVKIGPWEQERPPAPERGAARICFLTPSGLHFGEAPLEVLTQDPMAGHVFLKAAVLMEALIQKSLAS